MKTLRITGMHCQSCVSKVETALKAVEGVERVSVTLEPPQAIVSGKVLNGEPLAHAVSEAGDYFAEFTSIAIPQKPSEASQPSRVTTYYPLALVLTFVVAGAAILQFRGDGWDWSLFMSDFMGGFFLVFGFFKLLDVSGFANAYRSYDLIAAKWRLYGWVYPFVEVALGVAYLLRFQLFWTNVFTFLLMLIGTMGVIQALVSKQKIRCACLGTVFNLPMSTVTIVEDAGMAVMALWMILQG